MHKFLCVFLPERAKSDQICLEDFIGMLDPTDDTWTHYLTDNLSEVIELVSKQDITDYFYIYKHDPEEKDITLYNFWGWWLSAK